MVWPTMILLCPVFDVRFVTINLTSRLRYSDVIFPLSAVSTIGGALLSQIY